VHRRINTPLALVTASQAAVWNANKRQFSDQP